jgi:DNA-binding response OmpR family regulator
MILIVDADGVSGPSLARLLRYNGHAAELVPTPMEALALLPIRKPEAIIVELNHPAPHISGLQFIAAIRADRHFNDVPIIVYTTDYSAEAERGARAAGAQEVIIKGSVGTQSLLARIEAQLSNPDASA